MTVGAASTPDPAAAPSPRAATARPGSAHPGTAHPGTAHPGTARKATAVRRPRGRWAMRVLAIGFLIFLYAPVLLLPLFAFNDSAIVAFPITGLTTEWFERLWANPTLHQAVLNSLWVGLISALLATLLGLLAARAQARYAFPARRSLVGFIMIPMVLPEIILAVALLVVATQSGIGLSLWVVVAGHVLVCTPFAIAILGTAFQGLDRSLEEASLDLGESRLMTFWRVTLPLVLPGIMASLLLTFTISFDEFIISFFLTDVEVTLPVYIWSQVRFAANRPVTIALGFLLVVFTIGMLLMVQVLRARMARRTGQSSAAELFG